MRDAVSYPERQTPLARGGAMLLEYLVGFGVELSQKKHHHHLHHKSNRAQTSRIDVRWSAFFSFAYPGAAFVPCDIPFLG
jgi:hypothetical protein